MKPQRPVYVVVAINPITMRFVVANMHPDKTKALADARELITEQLVDADDYGYMEAFDIASGKMGQHLRKWLLKHGVPSSQTTEIIRGVGQALLEVI